MSNKAITLTVSVPFRKVQVSSVSHTFENKNFDVRPFKVTRRPCGRVGAAKRRYYYQAHFAGADGMIDINNESLVGRNYSANVNRKENKSFDPSSLKWDCNTAWFD